MLSKYFLVCYKSNQNSLWIRTNQVKKCLMSPTEQHSFPMHSLCQNQQQVPIRHDTVYGPGHGKCAVFHPAGRTDGEDG